MPVYSADSRIAKQNTAAAIGLQAMFVRVNNNRVGLGDGIKDGTCPVIQGVDQGKVTAIRCIDMHPEIILPAQLKDGG